MQVLAWAVFLLVVVPVLFLLIGRMIGNIFKRRQLPTLGQDPVRPKAVVLDKDRR